MAPQLVEKEVYVNMKALEKEAVVRLWEPVGAPSVYTGAASSKTGNMQFLPY